MQALSADDAVICGGKRCRARVLTWSASAHDIVSTLCSAAAAVIPAHGKAVVPTDLAIACPPGTYARIAPRSGLAVKHFIDTGAAHWAPQHCGSCDTTLVLLSCFTPAWPSHRSRPLVSRDLCRCQQVRHMSVPASHDYIHCLLQAPALSMRTTVAPSASCCSTTAPPTSRVNPFARPVEHAALTMLPARWPPRPVRRLCTHAAVH